jgi:Immunoglobulin-like domain of bacterial spore germination
MMKSIGIVVVTTAALAGCGGDHAAGPCASADGALGFVFVEAPASGERVSSGFRVSGCSSTYEATLHWRLLARDGHPLARPRPAGPSPETGIAQGGSTEPGSFAFTVRYSVDRRQIGYLEVSGTRGATRPEGFAPPRDVVPLVLEP